MLIQPSKIQKYCVRVDLQMINEFTEPLPCAPLTCFSRTSHFLDWNLFEFYLRPDSSGQEGHPADRALPERVRSLQDEEFEENEAGFCLKLKHFGCNMMELADILWWEQWAAHMSHFCCQITGNRDGYGGLRYVWFRACGIISWYFTNMAANQRGHSCHLPQTHTHTQKSCLIK